jgi:hypothetical protein
VLRIFIALKNSSPSPGIEIMNVVSNIKHASQYATDDDWETILFKFVKEL